MVIRPRPTIGPVDGGEVVLRVTVALLVIYVIGIGGATATAIHISEAWRRRPVQATGLGPRAEGELVLPAPELPTAFRRIRLVGWVVFPIALFLAGFVNRGYLWIAAVAVLVMVGLNGFYVTAMQGMGERVALTTGWFR